MRSGERGHALVVLVGVLAVLAVALTAALPHWGALVQRDKEAELVARGLQYAEALRVFQRRFGRLPVRLEELVEVEPRAIRQLWRDPFAADGSWLLLVETPGGQIAPFDPVTGALVGAAPEEESVQPPAAPAFAAAAVAGPIHGVRSRARREAYRILFDQRDVGAWEFSVERLIAATSALAPDGLPRRTTYASYGRPFLYPPPGGLPGQSTMPPGVPSTPSPPETPRPPGQRESS
jgi:type II secretory pathway pseudopilin PulG